MLNDLGALRGGIQEQRRCLFAANASNMVRPRVVLAARQRGVDPVQQRCSPLAVRTDDDAVRVQEVHDCRTFTQKLGVRDDVEEVASDAVALDRAANPLIRVNGNGALLNDYLVARQGAGNLAGHRLHIRKVGVAGLALGGSYSDKDRLTLAGRFAQIGREANFLIPVALEKLRKEVLVDQSIAALQRGNFALIIVNTDHMVTHLCETNSSDEADVPGTYYSDRNFLAHSVSTVVPLSWMTSYRLSDLSPILFDCLRLGHVQNE